MFIHGLSLSQLYAFTKPENLDARVVWRDARMLMTVDEFEGFLTQGYKVANVCDLGRLRGIKKEFEKGATYVWMIDLDTQWVRNIKAACSQLPAAAFSHVVGTMQGLKSSRAGMVKSLMNGMLHFLIEPFDYMFAATPIRFTRRTTLLEPILQHMEQAMGGPNASPNYQVSPGFSIGCSMIIHFM